MISFPQASLSAHHWSRCLVHAAALSLIFLALSGHARTITSNHQLSTAQQAGLITRALLQNGSGSSGVTDPGDGGPFLCPGDSLPRQSMDPFSTLFGYQNANNASMLEPTDPTVFVSNKTEGGDTRHRVNLRFKQDVDPILQLANALETVLMSASDNDTNSTNATTTRVSLDKLKEFLHNKTEGGWMGSDRFTDWFSNIPGMESVMSQVAKMYYGMHTRVMILDFESKAVAEAVNAILGGMSDWVEVSTMDVVVKPKDLALSLNGPDDPFFGRQWGLASVGAIQNPRTRTPGAWAATTGDKGIVVAVVDTGIDYTHPDLAANVWVNEGEIPGNGIDDDGNGYVDDYHGFNFVEGASDSSDVMDDHFHGTHVSGIIGAVGNNDLGISGVAPNVSIMALKVLNSDGAGATSWNIQALEYALMMGADVFSASLGGYDEDPILTRLFNYASDKGMVLVAAAGNERTNTDEKNHYPSGGDQATLISVAASVQSGCIAGFSNYGVETVDIVAPGDYIISTIPTYLREYSGYARASGTSQATPFVAGAAALVLSYMKQSGQEYKGQGVAVKQLLMQSARQSTLYRDFVASGGALDVGKALETAANTTFSAAPSGSPPPRAQRSPPSPASSPGRPSNPLGGIFGSSATWMGMKPWVYMVCIAAAVLACL